MLRSSRSDGFFPSLPHHPASGEPAQKGRPRSRSGNRNSSRIEIVLKPCVSRKTLLDSCLLLLYCSGKTDLRSPGAAVLGFATVCVLFTHCAHRDSFLHGSINKQTLRNNYFDITMVPLGYSEGVRPGRSRRRSRNSLIHRNRTNNNIVS